MEELLIKSQLNLMAALPTNEVTEAVSNKIEQYTGKTPEQLASTATDLAGSLIAAIAIFIIGRFIARIISSTLEKVLRKRKVDATLVEFVGSFSYMALLVFVILAAITELGIQTTSFVAVIGAAGLAVGLALQGSLANFASGVLLIMFRPFKIGDYVEGGGTAGTVEEISIFTTILKTPDNRKIIVPNSSITSGNIINYSAKDTRRVDMVFGIGYGDDIDKARKVLIDVLEKEERVLKDPAYTIAIGELGASSVDFVCRPWVKSGDYWGVKFDITEAVKKRFDEENISIPFPQQDVHLYKHEG